MGILLIACPFLRFCSSPDWQAKMKSEANIDPGNKFHESRFLRYFDVGSRI